MHIHTDMYYICIPIMITKRGYDFEKEQGWVCGRILGMEKGNRII